MKKLIICLILFLFKVNISFGQLTIDHVYTTDGPDKYISMGYSGLKYVSLHFDFNSQTYTYFTLYNPDHSVFKTITIPQFAGKNVNKISHISESLFDTDSLVEFIVGYIFTGGGGISALRVCNENGMILLERDTAGVGGQNGALENGIGGQVIFPNGTSSKLIVGKASYSGGWIYTTEIYNLPGQLPCLDCSNGLVSGIVNPGNIEIKKGLAYPNPFTNGVKIKYELPLQFNKAFVALYDIKGNLIKQKEIDSNFNEIYLSDEEMKQGMYIYKIIVDGKTVTSDKIIKL